MAGYDEDHAGNSTFFYTSRKTCQKGKESHPLRKIDLLSRIVLSDHALTPQDLTVQMGLYKSAVSRLIDHLEKKGFLKKHYCETDKRSYVLLITETGNMELDCTYRYYLEPIYKLREVLGAESFESLTTQIQTANELLQDKKTGR